MKIAWVCRLVEHPRPSFWCPRILQWADSVKESFPVRWVTTPGNRLNPWAVGLANVTAAQRTALNDAIGILIIDDFDLTKTLADLPLAKRTAIRTFIEGLGFTVQNTEQFTQLLNRLIATEEVKSLLSLDLELGA